MPLSKKQTTLYWRTWRDVCVFMGWKSGDSARRYALHGEAECPASMTGFGNKDFDRFLKYCDRLLGNKVKGSDEAGERDRLIWRIRKDATAAGLSEAYLKKLSTDRTGLGCWEELALKDLEQFRNTIRNRAAAKGKVVERGLKADVVVNEFQTVTGDNIPF